MKFNPTVTSLDAQIADLQNRARNSSAGDTRGEIQRLMEQRNMMVGQDAAKQMVSGGDPMKEARDRITQLTEGRADELRKDPVHGSIMDYLKGVMSGTSTPYNDETVNAMQSQFGRGASAREAAQMQQLRDSLQATGGSIYDPSYQAAGREIESKRQGANLDYAGQLAMQSNLANFDARNQAATQMSGMNSNQNQQISNLGLTGASYRARDFQQVPQASPAQAMGPILMPQYMPQQQQGPVGGQTTQQPKPAAPAAPNPAAFAAPGTPGAKLAGPPRPTGQAPAVPMPFAAPGTPGAKLMGPPKPPSVYDPYQGYI
jgi:hypothetical protein